MKPLIPLANADKSRITPYVIALFAGVIAIWLYLVLG